MGAEFLLGRGDMLYKSGIETIRVHGAFVSESEIEHLAQKLKILKPQFDPDALEYLQNSTQNPPYFSFSDDKNIPSDDELFNQAIKIVVEFKTASASLLQRRLRIGYNRAANLLEEMEAKGLVGQADGSKPRKVLSKAEEYL
jgi:S-DNA-T family DNA segregation ATPase FtsK/SpoIIIE